MKYLILGAGPAGLTLANKLIQACERDFLVLEKEKTAGGLCRSADVDGSPLDISGGHFLDVCRLNVNNFLFQFMPENEWEQYERKTTIKIRGVEIGQPIESYIWQMGIEDQIDYLKSIAEAGCNIGTKMPTKFVEWIYWKLGQKIADEYMIPYNQKMFGKNLDLLGTYWLYKLPNVSFEDTLRSCLEKRAYGSYPGHARFYYPREYGYGELWTRMALELGDNIVYNAKIETIDFDKKIIVTSEGAEYHGDIIINTIPWTAFKELYGMPCELKERISNLRHSSIEIAYCSDHLNTESHWVYYPDLDIPYHRILVRHNFCPNSKGYWTETNVERISMNTDMDAYKYITEYAYPLNTIDKPIIIKDLLSWCKNHGVIGLGRWGEHQHYNSDVTVDLAMKLTDELLK